MNGWRFGLAVGMGVVLLAGKWEGPWAAFGAAGQAEPLLQAAERVRPIAAPVPAAAQRESARGAGQGLVRETLIDGFDYSDADSARRAWRAEGQTPAVELFQEAGKRGIQFAVPFAERPKLERTVHDRQVSLDLAAAGGFVLELAVEPTETAGHLSLYFRSGAGWYAAGKNVRQTGWQTLHFSKAEFRIEGQPTGWRKIDGIRISIWRGANQNGQCRLARLAALQRPIALVIPAGRGQKRSDEIDTARETAERVAELLADLGLGADAVEDADLPHGALGDRKVALLAYLPRVEGSTLEALETYVQKGGKLIVCYSLPPRLAKLLGLKNPKYLPQSRPGQFAQIRLEAADAAGLPSLVRQASWNITAAEPEGYGARVIGWWLDDRGQATGQPALLLSERGAFFTHIILPDDPEGKKQMLAALLGHLAPPLWREMAQAAVGRIGQVGHLSDRPSVEKFLADAQKTLSAEEQKELADRLARLAEAEKKLSAVQAAGDGPAVIESARQVREALVQAYVAAQPSPQREGRAIWNHSGAGAYEGDWERTAKELAAAGFNMVLPNMLWAGLAHYPSQLLPQSNTFKQHGDQAAQCVAACHRYGLEVHVWKVNWNLSTAPKDFLEKMRSAGRTQIAVDGKPIDWLCPSHPENFQLERDSMLEVLRKYPIDGLHFDYIRYPHGQACYCPGCRERFEKERGAKVTHWPEDCYRGPLREEYRTWRCRQITRLVEAVRQEAKKIRPEAKISAAVFGAYPDCRESVGQDWAAWVQAGLLDFVCPMDYTQNDLEFQNLVRRQLELVGGRAPVYPGIGAWRLTPDRTVGQVYLARQLGAQGFTIFNLDLQSIQTHAPAIGAGAGRHKAAPFHRTSSSPQ